MKEIRSISLIGYGLVGRAMATYFQSKGLEIHQILVRKKPSQNHMESAPFNFITQLELLEPCDLLLVCVNDDALIDLIPQLPKSQWIAYTSGAVGLDVFENAPPCFGVLSAAIFCIFAQRSDGSNSYFN